jgi:hypothetical protein
MATAGRRAIVPMIERYHRGYTPHPDHFPRQDGGIRVENSTRAARRQAAAVFAAIETVLTPYVGRNMASTAAAAQCRRLGLEGASFAEGDIAKLVDRLGLGLKVFLGEARTAEVLATIRNAIAALPEAP